MEFAGIPAQSLGSAHQAAWPHRLGAVSLPLHQDLLIRASNLQDISSGAQNKADVP